MKTPYEVLGLSKDSSREDLEKRYNELKKEYGEGRFLTGEAGMQSARNLHELEIAWQDILEELKVSEAIGGKEEVKAEEIGVQSSTSASVFAYIDTLIKEKKYDEAQRRLDDITDRNGEWHYLQSRVYYYREWLMESKKHLTLAVQADPTNEKYKNALDKMETIMGNKNADPRFVNDGNGQQAGGQYYEQNRQGGCNLLECCTTYCLVSTCCDCCALGCR